MIDEIHTIPDEIVSRTARLINEAEDMRQQAADDLKQIYADLREELKALGWDGKHVSAEVAALKGAISEMRLDEKSKEKREARGERVDDYVSLLTRARARESFRSPRKAAEAVSERAAFQVEADVSAEATIEGQPSETVATSAESAGEAVSAVLPTNQPETANLSGADTDPGETAAEGICEAVTVVGTESGTVVNPNRPANLAVPGGEPSTPSSDDGGAKMDELHPHPGRSDATSAHNSAKSEQATNTIRKLRPHCQRPEMCGSGTRDHCWTCKKAIREGEAA